ncbi:MAG TPA: glycosyltransferase family 4 protein [Chloroflexi bacterium]|nr:glycosyltransferase family 4 protein [Chloroflexota bacterium]
MRILIFTNAYKPTVSGVVISIALFRRGLLTAGHDVHIVAPEYGEYQDEEPYIFRFPAIDLPERLDLSLVLPFRLLMSPTVQGVKPDLIHSQHPFVMGGLASTFAQDLGVPLVFTFHTRYDQYAQQYIPLVPDLAGLVTEEVVERYLERCAHVIAPTPSIREFILREYQPDVPVSVVPTPVDLEQYHDLEPGRIRADWGLEEAEVLLYVGRLAREKNLQFLLRAFARVASERPQARLLLVGRGPHEHDLEQFAQQLGLGERVIFVGPVAHTEIPHYVAAADLFVFSSQADTQGLVLIEAMAAGTPVVAVQAPGPVDVLAEGGGQLVAADAEEFASAVVALLADPARRQALQRDALRVVQQYTIAAATERLLGVYEEAVAAGPRPAKGLQLSLQPDSVKENWREISDQVHALSENLSTSLNTAWDGDEVRHYLQDVRSGLRSFLRQIDQIIQSDS